METVELKSQSHFNSKIYREMSLTLLFTFINRWELVFLRVFMKNAYVTLWKKDKSLLNGKNPFLFLWMDKTWE